MRLWHLVFAVAVVGVVMTLGRDPISRVFLIIFITGIGEVVFALASLMALFQAVGFLGRAEGLIDHAEALLSTAAVLAVGTVAMSGWFFVGFWLVCKFA